MVARYAMLLHDMQGGRGFGEFVRLQQSLYLIVLQRLIRNGGGGNRTPVRDERQLTVYARVLCIYSR